jgi:hypothetical protein
MIYNLYKRSKREVFLFPISTLGQRKARTLKFAKCACELILQQDFKCARESCFFYLFTCFFVPERTGFGPRTFKRISEMKSKVDKMSNSNHGQPFESKIYFGKSSAHVILL